MLNHWRPHCCPVHHPTDEETQQSDRQTDQETKGADRQTAEETERGGRQTDGSESNRCSDIGGEDAGEIGPEMMQRWNMSLSGHVIRHRREKGSARRTESCD